MAMEKSFDGYHFLSCIGGGHSNIIASSAISDYGGVDMIQWEGDWAKRELIFDASRIGDFSCSEQGLQQSLVANKLETYWFEYKQAAAKYAFSTVLGSIRNLKTFVKMSIMATQGSWVGTYHDKYVNELLTAKGRDDYASMLKASANSLDTGVAFATLAGRQGGRKQIANVMCRVLDRRKNLQPAWADDKSAWSTIAS